MRRPRIALWIKWHCRLRSQYVVRVAGNMRRWPVPNWLWRWAVRRVDRWHLLTATLPQWTAFDKACPDLTPEKLEELIGWAKKRSEDSTTLTGKLHR